MTELTITLPPEALEQIAQRAAAIVLEQLDAEPSASEFLNVQETAELLRCERERVYQLASAGILARYKDGARVLFRRAEVLAYLGAAA